MTIYYSEPFTLDIRGRSVFVGGEPWDFTVRDVKGMAEVLMDKKALPKDFPLYFMYRGLLEKEGMRYDITIMPPKLIAGEFAKTYGHYHPKDGGGLGYPEVYQIIDGSAVFIMQKKRSDYSVDAMIVRGERGDAVLIPPNWGHVTVNPAEDRVLVLSNVVANCFDSDYADYKENRGAAFYYTKGGFVQNERYIIRSTERKTVEELNGEYGVAFSDIFKEFNSNPEKFEFLKKPGLIKHIGAQNL